MNTNQPVTPAKELALAELRLALDCDDLQVKDHHITRAFRAIEGRQGLRVMPHDERLPETAAHDPIFANPHLVAAAGGLGAALLPDNPAARALALINDLEALYPVLKQALELYAASDLAAGRG